MQERAKAYSFRLTTVQAGPQFKKLAFRFIQFWLAVRYLRWYKFLWDIFLD